MHFLLTTLFLTSFNVTILENYLKKVLTLLKAQLKPFTISYSKNSYLNLDITKFFDFALLKISSISSASFIVIFSHTHQPLM